MGDVTNVPIVASFSFLLRVWMFVFTDRLVDLLADRKVQTAFSDSGLTRWLGQCNGSVLVVMSKRQQRSVLQTLEVADRVFNLWDSPTDESES